MIIDFALVYIKLIWGEVRIIEISIVICDRDVVITYWSQPGPSIANTDTPSSNPAQPHSAVAKPVAPSLQRNSRQWRSTPVYVAPFVKSLRHSRKAYFASYYVTGEKTYVVTSNGPQTRILHPTSVKVW